MADHFDEGFPADRETPVHPITLPGFEIDAHPVTNERFAEFISATGYDG